MAIMAALGAVSGAIQAEDERKKRNKLTDYNARLARNYRNAGEAKFTPYTDSALSKIIPGALGGAKMGAQMGNFNFNFGSGVGADAKLGDAGYFPQQDPAAYNGWYDPMTFDQPINFIVPDDGTITGHSNVPLGPDPSPIPTSMVMRQRQDPTASMNGWNFL